MPGQFVTAAVPEHMQSISAASSPGEICLGQCGVERKARSKVLEQSELHQCHHHVHFFWKQAQCSCVLTTTPV